VRTARRNPAAARYGYLRRGTTTTRDVVTADPPVGVNAVRSVTRSGSVRSIARAALPSVQVIPYAPDFVTFRFDAHAALVARPPGSVPRTVITPGPVADTVVATSTALARTVVVGVVVRSVGVLVAAGGVFPAGAGDTSATVTLRVVVADAPPTQLYCVPVQMPALVEQPKPFVTVTRAVYEPAAAYVCVGCAPPLASAVPSPKSQS
jgi:hypothetical protein